MNDEICPFPHDTANSSPLGPRKETSMNVVVPEAAADVQPPDGTEAAQAQDNTASVQPPEMTPTGTEATCTEATCTTESAVQAQDDSAGGQPPKETAADQAHDTAAVQPQDDQADIQSSDDSVTLMSAVVADDIMPQFEVRAQISGLPHMVTTDYMVATVDDQLMGQPGAVFMLFIFLVIVIASTAFNHKAIMSAMPKGSTLISVVV